MAEASNDSRGKSSSSHLSGVAKSISSDKRLDRVGSLHMCDGRWGKKAVRTKTTQTPACPSKVANSILLEKPLDLVAALHCNDGGWGKKVARTRTIEVANSILPEKPLDLVAALRYIDGGWGKKVARTRTIEVANSILPEKPLDLVAALRYSNGGWGKKVARTRTIKVANSILPEKPLDLVAALRCSDGGWGKKAARTKTIWVTDTSSDEDESCMLVSDPIHSVTLKNEMSLAQTPDGAFQDEDITIISEKGEVACRDFPHPRHLCAKFPFTTTAHHTCCSKCYCYVCDVLAPCERWNGTSGHCNASDQDPKWKDMRRAHRS